MQNERSRRGPRQRGFTLMELLVVVGIIGILSAIAIPQFGAYRVRGFRARIQSDARNAATAEEAFFAESNTYTSDCAALPGFTRSDGVAMTCAGDATAFTITTEHPGAPGFRCTYSSAPAAGAPNLVCTATGRVDLPGGSR